MNAWRHAIRFLFAADKVQLLLLLCLVAAGCLFIYGTGQQAGGNLERYWQRQLVFAAAGFAAYLVVSCVNYRFWCRWA